jgi:hypothetical protein
MSNPVLGFRLDPGEPGVIHSSKASTSTIAVFSQENRNRNRLVAEAVRRGERVIRTDVNLKFTRNGSYVSANSGHTAVKSIKANGDAKKAEKTGQAEGGGSTTAKSEQAKSASDSSQSDSREIEELESDLNELSAEKKEIEKEQNLPETETRDARQGLMKPETENKLKIDRIEKEINKIQYEIVKKRLEDLNKKMSGLMNDYYTSEKMFLEPIAMLKSGGAKARSNPDYVSRHNYSTSAASRINLLV